jgi:glucans biosynthesis protein C
VLFIITFFDLGGPDRLLGTDYYPWSLAFRLAKATAGWAWTFAIFGFAISRMRPREPAAPAAQRPVMGYANEAVLPFYVLHQTPIIVIGFYVVQWRVGIVPKYLVIALASLLATVLIYEFGVRRIRLARLAFGMPPLDARRADASQRPVAGDRR